MQFLTYLHSAYPDARLKIIAKYSPYSSIKSNIPCSLACRYALGKVRISPRGTLACTAIGVQGIRLKACRGLSKSDNAESLLL